MSNEKATKKKKIVNKIKLPKNIKNLDQWFFFFYFVKTGEKGTSFRLLIGQLPGKKSVER